MKNRVFLDKTSVFSAILAVLGGNVEIDKIPTLSAMANKINLWPPNHNIVVIIIEANASDNLEATKSSFFKSRKILVIVTQVLSNTCEKA